MGDAANRAKLLRASQRSGEALASELASLLSDSIEVRLDVRDLLDSLANELVDRSPILLRARGLNFLETGQLAEAHQLIDRARQICPPEAKPDCLLDLALVAREWTGWDESSLLLDQVEALELTPNQQGRLLNMRAVEAMVHRQDFEQARQLFRNIEKASAARGDRNAYLTAVINRGLGVERTLGRSDRMLECAAEILKQYGGEPPIEDKVYELRLRAEAGLLTGDPGASATALELADLAGGSLAHARGYGLSIAAYTAARSGEVEKARDLGRQAIDACLPFNSSTAIARLALARCAALQGRAEEAARLCEEASQEDSSPGRRLSATLELATGQLICGRNEECLAAASIGEAEAAKAGAERDQALFCILLSAVSFREDRARKAISLLEFSPTRTAALALLPHALALMLARSLERGICTTEAAELLREGRAKCLVVRVIGTVAISSEQGLVQVGQWKRPKALHLFLRLLASHPTPVDQLELMDDLWPDLEPETARASLQVAASYARSVLGKEAVVARHGAMGLKIPQASWVDLIHLRQAVSARNPAACRRALAEIAKGEVMPGVQGEWIDSLRAEVARLRATASRLVPTEE